VRHVGARAQDPADFESADHRQIQVQDNQIRYPLGDGFERGVARSDDVRLGFPAAFEGVLDQPGNVLLVFDDDARCLAMGRVRRMPQVSLRCLSC
jgi:hypothetical protein